MAEASDKLPNPPSTDMQWYVDNGYVGQPFTVVGSPNVPKATEQMYIAAANRVAQQLADTVLNQPGKEAA